MGCDERDEVSPEHSTAPDTLTANDTCTLCPSSAPAPTKAGPQRHQGNSIASASMRESLLPPSSFRAEAEADLPAAAPPLPLVVSAYASNSAAGIQFTAASDSIPATALSSDLVPPARALCLMLVPDVLSSSSQRSANLHRCPLQGPTTARDTVNPRQSAYL